MSHSLLSGKKILIGITGSIAAYKIPILVRQLIKRGAEVKVVMTPAATAFVSRLTLATVSRQPVWIDLFEGDSWTNHVALGRWADVVLIAPLSCNTLSKMATGLCDNLLMATYLSATCPVVAAPAMDEDMWHHATTQLNLQTIQSHGVQVIPVAYGELASGLTGDGRMAEPEQLVQMLEAHFSRSASLKNKKVLITAGPTYEAIDPVRFISNHSTGKMGYALAAEMVKRGAEVTLVSGPVQLKAAPGVQLIPVIAAADMYAACMERAGEYDIAIMAAAVADYTPVHPAPGKIKKGEAPLQVALKKTADILATLGAQKKQGQLLVGFALETDNEKENALKKLHDKKADLIILNSLNNEGAGFGFDTNKVTLFSKDGSVKEYETKSKALVAKDIVDTIIEMMPS